MLSIKTKIQTSPKRHSADWEAIQASHLRNLEKFRLPPEFNINFLRLEESQHFKEFASVDMTFHRDINPGVFGAGLRHVLQDVFPA